MSLSSLILFFIFFFLCVCVCVVVIAVIFMAVDIPETQKKDIVAEMLRGQTEAAKDEQERMAKRQKKMKERVLALKQLAERKSMLKDLRSKKAAEEEMVCSSRLLRRTIPACKKINKSINK